MPPPRTSHETELPIPDVFEKEDMAIPLEEPGLEQEASPGSAPALMPAVTPARPAEVYTYETELGDRGKNRMKNIRTAAQKLTGAVIAPGEEFSFNRRVGARTVKAGYRVAPIIVEGKKEKGVGGGICQLSTTLYNAALKAGFDITERHEHTKEVGYVESGRDATVNYGHADLKIVNTGDRPVVIKCEVLRRAIRVTLTETV